MNAILKLFKDDQAELTTHSESGDDLEGTVIYKGISKQSARISLDNNWYAAYVRTATNEKGVVRSYISSGDEKIGKELQQRIITLLQRDFGGKEIE